MTSVYESARSVSPIAHTVKLNEQDIRRCYNVSESTRLCHALLPPIFTASTVLAAFAVSSICLSVTNICGTDGGSQTITQTHEIRAHI